MQFSYKGHTIYLSRPVVIRKTSERLIDEKMQRKFFESFSQYHEDALLWNAFFKKKNGFYVDIGANDPSFLSNTKKYYDCGWSGINVEPNITLYQKLLHERPRDINVNSGISNVKGEMIFYQMDPDSLSSFNEAVAKKSMKIYKNAHITKQIPVQVTTLLELFNMHVGNKKIDFLSIDAEGLEMSIIDSNDWTKYRPSVVIVELNQDINDNVYKFLTEKEYAMVYFNNTNGIFVNRQ